MADVAEGGGALQVDDAVFVLCHEVDGAVALDAGIDGVACTTQDVVDLVFEAYFGIGGAQGVDQGGEGVGVEVVPTTA